MDEIPDKTVNMSTNFLLGPAGSGKTHRCLAEIRDALVSAPDGPPLLFIAPRQSTYLLERQLLSMDVRGFTRLEILSFDRLARRVLEELRQPIRNLLSEEGRVMALRALLTQKERELKGFGSSARATGFAAQLSQVLRELQRANTSVERLRNLRLPDSAPTLLTNKLGDLALMLAAYREWLKAQSVHDPDDLLMRAAQELSSARKGSKPTPQFAGVWLDGFAEMTWPEINLLTELLPCSDRATLAFCLENSVPVENATASSLWSLNAATFQRCRERVRQLGLQHEVTLLPLGSDALPRFKDAPALEYLASSWSDRATLPAPPLGGLNFVECTDPEAEALLAARLINDHVRNRSGRYREVSVIVRRMDTYADALQRTFRRHDIPFFADHREPMGHHPAAELTRSALSLAAHGWGHEDWIAALKTGLVVENNSLVDGLENATLARGVRGNEWLDLEVYQRKAGLSVGAVAELARPVAAFRTFKEALSAPVDGPALAAALRRLWTALRVPGILDQWQGEVEGMNLPPLYRTMHRTAWEQLQNWCDNLVLAFANTKLEAREWLPIAEAGLASLSLGVIPPALDQVFLGAVDRARQPDVKLTIVLGLNAGVFPAPPTAPPLLNRAERVGLQSEADLGLGWDVAQLASRENYYAYIACTRASERLCVSWSRRSANGKSLARSAVAERLLTFADLKANAEAGVGDMTVFDGRLKSFSGSLAPESVTSLPELFECPGWNRLLPANLATEHAVGLGRKACDQLREQLLPAGGEKTRRLSAPALQQLYPEQSLRSSVSALEKFAECPFHHFASQQLHLKEREEFEADQATIGTLLHAVLKEFHELTLREKSKWRDWSPAAAAKKIRELGLALMGQEKFAPQSQDELVRWESEQKIEGLALAVQQMVAWFGTNSFDPVLSEFKFRDQPDADRNPPDVPAWNLALAGGRTLKLQGSLDRLDVCALPDGRLLVAIFDYKTGGKSPSQARLQKGFELQLLGYLAFVVESPELKTKLIGLRPGSVSDQTALVPAGAFYVPLSPKMQSAGRDTTEAERKKASLKSLAHEGRANREWLEQFDNSAKKAGRTWENSLQFKPHEQSPNFQAAPDFGALLESARGFLRQHAGAILEGDVAVSPARFGSTKIACEYCPFQPVCRFEPVFGTFRSVTYTKPAESKTAGDDSSAAKTNEPPAKQKSAKSKTGNPPPAL